MKELLINVLETVCPNNVFLQNTIIDENEAYPESFITIWTNYTDDNSFYDNGVHSIDWHFSVMYYSSDPAQVASIPNVIIERLKAAGFIPQGKGSDLPSDVPTHTGWLMQFVKTEIV